MVDCYISRVEGGRLEVKKKVMKEELIKALPARFDFSKEIDLIREQCRSSRARSRLLQLVEKIVVAGEHVYKMPDHQSNAREELEVFVHREVDIAVDFHFFGEHRQ